MATKIAFRMKLRPGWAAEYRRRHDDAWPELLDLLRGAGISNYSIYLDPETDALFAVLWCEDPARVDALAAEPLMRRWWEHMRDIMETEPDASPSRTGLVPMFHLP